jgi:hypothetical protein
MMDLRQDPDRVPGRLVLAGGLVVIATIIVSVLAVVALTEGWRGRLASNPGDGWESRVPVEVSHVESGPYARPTDAERDASTAHRRLGSYGWVDRAHGRIHVPVDVAMDLMLAPGGGGGR